MDNLLDLFQRMLLNPNDQQVKSTLLNGLTRLNINFKEYDPAFEASVEIVQRFLNEKSKYPLEDLDLNDFHINNSDIITIGKITTLRNLRIQGSKGDITDITPLVDLKRLTFLSVGINKISDISVLENFYNLEILLAAKNKIKYLPSLRNLQSLSELWVYDNEIEDITPLRDLNNLKVLSIGGNKITDISAISKLPNLKGLYIASMHIRDITPIFNLSLKRLTISNVSKSEIKELRKQLPHCNILIV